MNFSIILASRERVYLLDSLLNSIINTTADKNNCEVICVLDNDDRVSKRFVERFKNTCPFAKFIFRDRANNLNDEYLNWAWRNFSTGDNIIIVNDDVVFKTMNWDQIVMAQLSRYLADKPDGIAYGWLQDGLPNRAGNINYCCFPLVTRKAAECLGFVMPPEFPGWGADIGIYRIYAAANRICDLSLVTLEHISHHNGSRSRDHISVSVEQKSVGSINPITEYSIGPHVDKLVRQIGTNGEMKSVVITGATVTNVTLTDATIVGGKIVGGNVVGSRVEGGKVVGGFIKGGTIEGDFQSGFVAGIGDVRLS